MNNNLTQIPPSRQAAWKNITVAEVALWTIIRSEQLNNERFFRHYKIDRFVIDFYCPKHKLAVELEEKAHLYQQEHDNRRTEYLNAIGITILQFKNSEVFNHSTRVLDKIEEHLKKGEDEL